MPKKKTLEDVEKATGLRKNKRTTRTTNDPANFPVESGDNTKMMKINLALFNMPDIDICNLVEVNDRINEYFELYAKYDMKPTVAGLALSLGIDRQTLYDLTHDRLIWGHLKPKQPPEVIDSIKKAYKFMEVMWESCMVSGKVNPVTGIFLGKNNYDYKDKVEHEVTAKQVTEDYSIDEIKQKYIESPEE